MAIDYDSFSEDERDNFVKNVLHEDELKAAISAYTKGGLRPRTAEELLDFCFRVAVKKMRNFQRTVHEKRGCLPQRPQDTIVSD